VRRGKTSWTKIDKPSGAARARGKKMKTELAGQSPREMSSMSAQMHAFQEVHLGLA